MGTDQNILPVDNGFNYKKFVFLPLGVIVFLIIYLPQINKKYSHNQLTLKYNHCNKIHLINIMIIIKKITKKYNL